MLEKLPNSAAMRNDDDKKDLNGDEGASKAVPLWVFLAIVAAVTSVAMVADLLNCGALMCRLWVTHLKEF